MKLNRIVKTYQIKKEEIKNMLNFASNEEINKIWQDGDMYVETVQYPK